MADIFYVYSLHCCSFKFPEMWKIMVKIFIQHVNTSGQFAFPQNCKNEFIFPIFIPVLSLDSSDQFFFFFFFLDSIYVC